MPQSALRSSSLYPMNLTLVEWAVYVPLRVNGKIVVP